MKVARSRASSSGWPGRFGSSARTTARTAQSWSWSANMDTHPPANEARSRAGRSEVSMMSERDGLTVGVSGEHSEAVRVHCTPG